MDPKGQIVEGSGGASEDQSDPFAQAFRELERQWGDDSAHKKFIAFCASQGALAEAGRRYREVRDTDPERKEEAQKRIDAVLGTAFQTMKVERIEVQRKGRLNWLVFGVCAFMVMYAILSVLRARSP